MGRDRGDHPAKRIHLQLLYAAFVAMPVFEAKGQVRADARVYSSLHTCH